MAEYIVNAQTQKLLAVKEAELKAEKKFQERLEKLFAAGGIPLPVEGGAAGGGSGGSDGITTLFIHVSTLLCHSGGGFGAGGGLPSCFGSGGSGL